MRRGGTSFTVLYDPSGTAGQSDTRVASGTNVGTATGNGTAVGVTLLSGARTGAPRSAGVRGMGP